MRPGRTQLHGLRYPVRGVGRGAPLDLTAAQRARVLRAIEVQLAHEPLRETRNRKPLRPNPVAPWELRVGQLRVFYDVVEDPPPTVLVLAVGVKDRAVLRIGGQEVQL